MNNHTAKPYQKEGVRFIEAHGGRALLADEMGLGKTPQALWWLRRNPHTFPAVVVCPSAVKYGWEAMAASFVGLNATVLEGRRPWGRLGIFRPQLVVLNFEIVDAWLPWLLKLNPASVIVDEVQNIQNIQARRTKAIKKLCALRQHLLCMSGTPFTNRPAELFSCLNLLWPEEFPSFFAYGMRYCKPYKAPWGKWVFKGAARLPELHDRLKTLGMVRRLKSDVMEQLDPINRRVVPLQLDAKDMQEYNEAANNFIAWMKANHGKLKAQRAAKAERIVQMGYLKRLAARFKLKHAVQWVDNFLAETDEKIVLFAWHRGAIAALARRYKGRCVVIDGSMTAQQKHTAAQQFKLDKRIRITVANLQSGGTGIDGLQAASTTAILEFDFRPAIHSQAEGRIDRIGRGDKIFAYYFVARGTIEEHLCEIIQNKKQVFHKVFDGTANIEDNLSIYDLLQSKLLEDARNARTKTTRPGPDKLLPAGLARHSKR